MQEILRRLLRQAHLSLEVHEIRRLGGSYTNDNSLVTLEDGTNLVLRQYRWPYEAPDMDRVAKEKFLHTLLAEHGVPVPRIIAAIEEKNESALLMEHLSGELLGDVAERLSGDECQSAWVSAGEALKKAHSIEFSGGLAGVIVGRKVEPFEGSWGAEQMRNICHHADRLLSRMPDISLDLQRLSEVLELAIPVLDRASVRLLHNDSHPWNVLVDRRADAWYCTGWLDWEFAWTGDPAWDLVRLDLFRMKPIGPTPDAFYEGYGSRPDELNRSLYELSIYLWMMNQYLDGGWEGLQPTYAAAMGYVSNISRAIDKIEEEVATRLL